MNDQRVQNASIPLDNGDILRFGYDVATYKMEYGVQEQMEIPDRGDRIVNRPAPSSPTNIKRQVYATTVSKTQALKPEEKEVRQQVAQNPIAAMTTKGGTVIKQAPNKRATPAAPVHTSLPVKDPLMQLPPSISASGSAADMSSIRHVDDLFHRSAAASIKLAQLETEREMKREQEISELKRQLAAEEAKAAVKKPDAGVQENLEQRMEALERGISGGVSQHTASSQVEPNLVASSSYKQAHRYAGLERELVECNSELRGFYSRFLELSSSLLQASLGVAHRAEKNETAPHLEWTNAISGSDAHACARALKDNIQRMHLDMGTLKVDETLKALGQQLALNQGNADAASKLKVAQEDLKLVQTKLKALESDSNARTQQMTMADVEAEKVASCERAYQTLATKLEERLDNANLALEKKEAELAQLNKADWARSLADSRKQVENLRSEMAIQEEEMAEMRQRFGKLSSQVAGYMNAGGVKAKEEAERSLQKFVSEQNRELMSLKRTISELETRGSESNRRWNALLAENTTLNKEVSALKAHATSLATRYQAALSQKDARLMEMNRMLAAYASASEPDRRQGAEFLVQQLYMQETALQDERASLIKERANMVSLKQRNAALQKELEKNQQNLQLNALQELEDRLVELEQSQSARRVAESGEEVRKLHVENAKLQTRAQDLESRLKLEWRRKKAPRDEETVAYLSSLLEERENELKTLRREVTSNQNNQLAASYWNGTHPDTKGRGSGKGNQSAAALLRLQKKYDQLLHVVRTFQREGKTLADADALLDASLASSESFTHGDDRRTKSSRRLVLQSEELPDHPTTETGDSRPPNSAPISPWNVTFASSRPDRSGKPRQLEFDHHSQGDDDESDTSTVGMLSASEGEDHARFGAW